VADPTSARLVGADADPATAASRPTKPPRVPLQMPASLLEPVAAAAQFEHPLHNTRPDCCPEGNAKGFEAWRQAAVF
jgi:hypothetical protein